jgi:hypothetical protein
MRHLQATQNTTGTKLFRRPLAGSRLPLQEIEPYAE